MSLSFLALLQVISFKLNKNSDLGFLEITVYLIRQVHITYQIKIENTIQKTFSELTKIVVSMEMPHK